MVDFGPPAQLESALDTGVVRTASIYADRMSDARAAFDAFAESSDGTDARLEEARTLIQMSEAAKSAGQVTSTEHEQCMVGIMRNLFLHDGTHVVVTGLSRRPELNGHVATVLGGLIDGRIPVEIPSAATHVRLRPGNMRPLPPDQHLRHCAVTQHEVQ